MREPPLGERARDGQQVVAMLERQIGAVAVAALTAEPLGEEALLRRALVGEIAAEERPQRGVGLDPVVEPVDQRFDRGAASDAPEEIATDERAVRLGVGKESTVLHRALSKSIDQLSIRRVRIKEAPALCPGSPLSAVGQSRRYGHVRALVRRR